jgi:UDP-N-acetylmuramoyl-L-alanyl-D-glutamate--2,6-diaminopimelate ligase
MKRFRKFLPKFLINFYHFLWSFFFALINKFPSKRIIVIGITGTKGKSTVSYLTYFLLQRLGFKTALSSSDFLFINEKEIERKERLTMPGRGFLQKFLKEAEDEGCEIAVIECTSEGLWQNRHAFINFDIAVFLNLHPEHIEHHGSYEAYRKAKGKLFKALEKSKERKSLRGFNIKKTIIVNLDDFESDYFLSFKAEQKIAFSLEATNFDKNFLLKPESYKISKNGISFRLEGKEFNSSLLGKPNLYNILASLSILKALGISLNLAIEPLKEFKGIPGRMEIIEAKGFKVVIDYAHTPESIEILYKTLLDLFKPKRLICLVSSAGGIRDKWKRPKIGELAAKYCSHIVITDEDPFDELPENIHKAIEIGAINFLNEYNIEKPIEIIPDRKEAILRLIEIAEKGDIVVTIGKGNEKYINYADKVLPWNEKEAVLSALESLGKNKKSKNHSKISTKTSL